MANDGGVRGGRVKFNNLSEVYEMMASKAVLTDAKELLEFGYPAQEDEQLLVYRGYSTKDARALGMLDSAASHALSTLKAMNVITLLLMGGPNRQSIYILHYRPTMEHFEQFFERRYRIERKTAPTTYDQLINDLVRIREELANMKQRIGELEEKAHLHGRNDVRGSQALS
jgi:hypothetical protein